MLWFSFYFHLVLQFIVAAPFFSHYYQVPHENENENNFLSHRIKTETKLTTIAVSVTAAPYENKNKNSHRHLVLQYIGHSYSSVITFPIRHFVGNTECGGSNQVAVAQVS